MQKEFNLKVLYFRPDTKYKNDFSSKELETIKVSKIYEAFTAVRQTRSVDSIMDSLREQQKEKAKNSLKNSKKKVSVSR